MADKCGTEGLTRLPRRACHPMDLTRTVRWLSCAKDVHILTGGSMRVGGSSKAASASVRRARERDTDSKQQRSGISARAAPSGLPAAKCESSAPQRDSRFVPRHD